MIRLQGSKIQRFNLVPNLPEVQTLMQGIHAFRMKINPETMHDSYGSWRECRYSLDNAWSRDHPSGSGWVVCVMV